MKKLNLILFILSVCIASCTKEKTDFQKSILGTWELESSSGSWGPTRFFLPGNNNLFILKEGYYEFKRNDTVINSGAYRLEKGKDCFGDEFKYFFRADNYSYHILSLVDGKLNFSTSGCVSDGGYSIYRKK